MEARDRLINVAVLGAALVAWILVGIVVTTRDPTVDPSAGPLGAALIGFAVGLTAAPLFWLLTFSRHRRIAYRGDWFRALRRGAWVGLVIGIFVALRLQDALQVPIAAFIITMVLVAEATLSAER